MTPKVLSTLSDVTVCPKMVRLAIRALTNPLCGLDFALGMLYSLTTSEATRPDFRWLEFGFSAYAFC